MENFSIKIDENVRLRLYKICRLCGDDNPNNTEILVNNKKNSTVDPDFHKKIYECVGIQVTKGDKMPQNACNVCREKINDFFDFREMCLATDVQTRRLLGLPDITVPKPDPAFDSFEDDKAEVEKTIKKKNPAAAKAMKTGKSIKAEKRATLELRRSQYETKKSSIYEPKRATSYAVKKSLPEARKTYLEGKKDVKLEREKTSSKVKKKVGVATKQPIDVKNKYKEDPNKFSKAKKRKASGGLLTEKPPNKRERLRENVVRKLKNPLIALDAITTNVVCTICNMSFSNAGELHRHLDTDHLPKVVLFHCIRCNESIEKKQDIKDHNLWHKLSKTPYECGRCEKHIMSLAMYTKHIQSCSVFVQHFEYKTKKCSVCNEEFATQNLYNWHKCIINQMKCEVCQQKFTKRAAMLRHVVRCTAIGLSTSLPVIDSALNPDLGAELESESDPLPLPEADDHFADAIDSDDGSETELNLKPNLEIDIEAPRAEPIGEEEHATPFVVIPSEMTSIENSRPNSNNGSSIATTTPADSVQASVRSNSDIDDSTSIRQPQTANTNVSTPMVCIKLSRQMCSTAKNSMNSVQIKSEIIDSSYKAFYDSDLCRNIKQEVDSESRSSPSFSLATTVAGNALESSKSSETLTLSANPIPKPTIKLVIKKQHGTLNSSFVDGSDIGRSEVESVHKKKKKKKSKVFKIPKGLALKMKQERLIRQNDEVSADANNENLEEDSERGECLNIRHMFSKHSKKDVLKKKDKHKGGAIVLDSNIRIKQERRNSEEYELEVGLSKPPEENDTDNVSLPIISQVCSERVEPIVAITDAKSISSIQAVSTIRIKQEIIWPETENESVSDGIDINTTLDVAETTMPVVKQVCSETVEPVVDASIGRITVGNKSIKIKSERIETDEYNEHVGGANLSMTQQTNIVENLHETQCHSKGAEDNIQHAQDAMATENTVSEDTAAEDMAAEDTAAEDMAAEDTAAADTAVAVTASVDNVIEPTLLLANARIKQEPLDTDIEVGLHSNSRKEADNANYTLSECSQVSSKSNKKKNPKRYVDKTICMQDNIRIKQERVEDDVYNTDSVNNEMYENVSTSATNIALAQKCIELDKLRNNRYNVSVRIKREKPDFPENTSRIAHSGITCSNVNVKQERIDADEGCVNSIDVNTDVTNSDTVQNLLRRSISLSESVTENNIQIKSEETETEEYAIEDNPNESEITSKPNFQVASIVSRVKSKQVRSSDKIHSSIKELTNQVKVKEECRFDDEADNKDRGHVSKEKHSSDATCSSEKRQRLKRSAGSFGKNKNRKRMHINPLNPANLSLLPIRVKQKLMNESNEYSCPDPVTVHTIEGETRPASPANSIDRRILLHSSISEYDNIHIKREPDDSSVVTKLALSRNVDEIELIGSPERNLRINKEGSDACNRRDVEPDAAQCSSSTLRISEVLSGCNVLERRKNIHPKDAFANYKEQKVFPMLRIKSEFNAFNFSDDDTVTTPENDSEKPEKYTMTIKTEPEFELSTKLTSENIVSKSRDHSDINSLVKVEVSSNEHEEINDIAGPNMQTNIKLGVTDLVISRVESISHEKCIFEKEELVVSEVTQPSPCIAEIPGNDNSSNLQSPHFTTAQNPLVTPDAEMERRRTEDSTAKIVLPEYPKEAEVVDSEIIEANVNEACSHANTVNTDNMTEPTTANALTTGEDNVGNMKEAFSVDECSELDELIYVPGDSEITKTGENKISLHADANTHCLAASTSLDSTTPQESYSLAGENVLNDKSVELNTVPGGTLKTTAKSSLIPLLDTAAVSDEHVNSEPLNVVQMKVSDSKKIETNTNCEADASGSNSPSITSSNSHNSKSQDASILNSGMEDDSNGVISGGNDLSSNQLIADKINVREKDECLEKVHAKLSRLNTLQEESQSEVSTLQVVVDNKSEKSCDHEDLIKPSSSQCLRGVAGSLPNNDALMADDDNTNEEEVDMGTHLQTESHKIMSIISKNDISSNCNQRLKDLIQDNNNLLGFFEDELSRNNDCAVTTESENKENPTKNDVSAESSSSSCCSDKNENLLSIRESPECSSNLPSLENAQTIAKKEPNVNFSMKSTSDKVVDSSEKHSIDKDSNSISPATSSLPKDIECSSISPRAASQPTVEDTARHSNKNDLSQSEPPKSSSESSTGSPSLSATTSTSECSSIAPRCEDPSPSHLNLLHMNEIAENTNNANIERELLNDLESISSDSNFEFDS